MYLQEEEQEEQQALLNQEFHSRLKIKIIKCFHSEKKIIHSYGIFCDKKS